MVLAGLYTNCFSAVKCRLCVMLVLLKHLVTSCWGQKEFSIFFKGQINLPPEIRLLLHKSWTKTSGEGVIISVGAVKSRDIFFCKGNRIFWKVYRWLWGTPLALPVRELLYKVWDELGAKGDPRTFTGQRAAPQGLGYQSRELVTGLSSSQRGITLGATHTRRGQEQQGGHGWLQGRSRVYVRRQGWNQLHSPGEEWEYSPSLYRAPALWPKVWLGVPGGDGQGDWEPLSALRALILFNYALCVCAYV